MDQALSINKRKVTLVANTPVFLNGLDLDAGDNPTYVTGLKGKLVDRISLWLSRVLGASTTGNVWIGVGTLANVSLDYTPALFNEDYTGVKLAAGDERSTECSFSSFIEVTLMSDTNMDVIVWERA